jgi:hypothetical protein
VEHPMVAIFSHGDKRLILAIEEASGNLREVKA